MIVVAVRAGARLRRLLDASSPVVRVRAYTFRPTGSALLLVWIHRSDDVARVRDLASPDVAVAEVGAWTDDDRDRLRAIVAELDHVGAFPSIADATRAVRADVAIASAA
jgi:hypothetical protein